MKKKISLCLLLVVAVISLFIWTTKDANARGGGSRPRPVIYVTSQGLFYDSIVTADPLPPNGSFQLLEHGGPTGLQTEFGPGDPEYLGGRWLEEGTQHYFSCPLLGPGRLTP